MKITNFLTEHNLHIQNVEEEVVLMNETNKEISPRFSNTDAVKMWMIKNTSEIFFKLYSEDSDK